MRLWLSLVHEDSTEPWTELDWLGTQQQQKRKRLWQRHFAMESKDVSCCNSIQPLIQITSSVVF